MIALFVVIPLLFMAAGYLLAILHRRSKKDAFRKRGDMGAVPVHSFNVRLKDGVEQKIMAATAEHARQLVTTPKQIIFDGVKARPIKKFYVTDDMIESITHDRAINSLHVRFRLAKK